MQTPNMDILLLGISVALTYYTITQWKKANSKGYTSPTGEKCDIDDSYRAVKDLWANTFALNGTTSDNLNALGLQSFYFGNEKGQSGMLGVIDAKVNSLDYYSKSLFTNIERQLPLLPTNKVEAVTDYSLLPQMEANFQKNKPPRGGSATETWSWQNKVMLDDIQTSKSGYDTGVLDKDLVTGLEWYPIRR